MILTCTKLVFAKPSAPIIDNSAVAISNGIILSAGTKESIIGKFPGHRIFHLNNAVLMPGLVNLHTHLELPPLLDTIRARTFPGWVLNLINAKKKLSENDYKTAAQKNIDVLAHTGTTMVCEICTHDASPVLLKQSGMRAVVFDEIIDMRGNEPKHSSKFKVRSSKLKQSRLILRGLSPHTPYTVSGNLLARIRDITSPRGFKLAMHIAESKDEIRLLRREKSGLEQLYQFADWNLAWAPKGSSPFEYLDRIGLLSSHLLAVHAVHVTNADIALIKKRNVAIAHCPRSNKEIAGGKMPLKKIIDAGITVGLGTDSLASVPTLSMWDEMRYAYRIHKRDGISAEDIIGLATIGGAKALGMGQEIGSLGPGKKADIIAISLPKRNTGDLYSDLLRETKSCIMSMVNGKILYKEG